MKRIALALVVGASLSGCAAAPLGAGVAVGWIAAATLANQDADEVLTLAKPINEAACLLRPWNPKSAEALAAVNAFCANLPDDVDGFIVQQYRIIEAIDKAHEAESTKSKMAAPQAVHSSNY